MRDALLISFPFRSMRNLKLIRDSSHWQGHRSLLMDKSKILQLVVIGAILILTIFYTLQRGEHSICGKTHDEMTCFSQTTIP